MLKKYSIVILLSVFVSVSAWANTTVNVPLKKTTENTDTMQHSGHMDHGGGMIMFGITQGYMRMSGNLDGTNDVSDAEIFENFMMAPKEMETYMTMFHLMYMPTDDLSLMAMVPYLNKTMTMEVSPMMGGGDTTTRSSGFGDTSLLAKYQFLQLQQHRFSLVMGVSLPTGRIDAKDTTSMSNGEEIILPYAMQLGSGTFSLLPGVAYEAQTNNGLSWGSELQANIRMGKNYRDYRLGNVYQANIWLKQAWRDYFATYLRGQGKYVGSIHGADPDLNPTMSPTADPDLTEQKTITLFAGIDLFKNMGILKGNKLNIEFGLPVYQDLTGPQMKQRWRGSINWTYML